MNTYLNHIINADLEAREVLRVLSGLPDFSILTLFVIDKNKCLVGTVTDGDIRRGLLNGLEISDPISKFMHSNFRFLKYDANNIEQIKQFKTLGINLIPVLDEKNKLIEIINLKKRKTSLPISVLLMAGGKGERLKPLTNNIPKPMLLVGKKPIIEHNIDRLIEFGVTDFFISVKYLKDSIINYFGDGKTKGISIKYIEETEPLGTIGALSLISENKFKDILVMNSDILTNIDYEDFYTTFKGHNADMTLVSIPYVVAIPYAVLKTQHQFVNNFEEKPNYTYYSNGGIYLINSKLHSKIPTGIHYNATDLMDLVINDEKCSLTHYPLLSYWLDIGRHSDFLKAQEDITHLIF